jgi:hypothetical protein
MDNRDFKKHLSNLVHGHHHPEEHDWGSDTAATKPAAGAKPRKRPQHRNKHGTK